MRISDWSSDVCSSDLPKLVWEIASKHTRALWYYYQIDRIRRTVRNDPQRKNYTDAALAPVDGDETETMEMFTHNEGARNEVARRSEESRVGTECVSYV